MSPIIILSVYEMALLRSDMPARYLTPADAIDPIVLVGPAYTGTLDNLKLNAEEVDALFAGTSITSKRRGLTICPAPNHLPESSIPKVDTSRIAALEADAKAANEAGATFAAQAATAVLEANALKAALAKLETAASRSRTGVTVERVYHAEEGRVTDNGFRVISYHNPGPVKPTLVDAIQAFTLPD